MALSDSKINGYIKRLLLSRMRILCNHGFYGLLLMHMVYAVSEELETACTDGVRITFGTEFLDSLSDSELDFVMMHEILHVALQHCLRGKPEDPAAYNIAADIVVNSNILLESGMKLSSITLQKYGTSMHIAPDGHEGHEYTAEQVYAMLRKNPQKSRSGMGCGSGKGSGSAQGGSASGRGKTGSADGHGKSSGEWDDHSQWGKCEEDETLREVWAKRFEDAAEAIEVRDPSNQRGLLPKFAQRVLLELRKPQTDWRTILNEFVQEEVVDYSFTPPDRRFDDCPFFLPDFNDKDDKVEDILFMIDTSGSMSDEMITAAYSEVKGAIDQFNGKLKGWLGFFDAAVIEPKPFETVDEFKIIRPAGGGGTDFEVIFKYVTKHMAEKPPASIIILTDGFAPFPKEALAGGIPVLWLLNNEKVDPPWGKVARIKI